MYQRFCRTTMNILNEIKKEAGVPLTVLLDNGKCANNLSLSFNDFTLNMRRRNASLLFI